MLTQINSIKGLCSTEQTTFPQILDNLKTPLKKVIEARNEYQLNGKSELYQNQLKLEIPAINWKFNFSGGKSTNNITTSTGYIWYDIENTVNIKDIPNYNKYVFLHYKSLSNKGEHIVVKYSGLTVENYSYIAKQIANELNLSSHPNFDFSCLVPQKFTSLSFDPKLYYNPNSLFLNEIEVKQKGIIPELLLLRLATNDTFFRYNNLNDYKKNNETNVIKNGVPIVRLYLPDRIEEGKRNQLLFNWCIGLVWLNQDKTNKEVINEINKINKSRCIKPLSISEIEKIVENVFELKDRSSLQPYHKIQKIFFAKNNGMNEQERRTEINQIIGGWKKEKTQQKINDVIENWNFEIDGKITANKIKDKSGISLPTIKRHYHIFKNLIKDLNETNS